MEPFVIYADWQVGQVVDATLLTAIDEAWPAGDESFCSSTGAGDPEALTLSFDIDAASIEDASARGEVQVRNFCRGVELPGRLLRVVVYHGDSHLARTIGDG